MKTRYFPGFVIIAAFMLGLAFNLISCTKEDILVPQASASDLKSVTFNTANAAVVLSSQPIIASPDTGLHLIPNGVYFITRMGQPTIWPESKRVIEVTYPWWTILQVQVDNRSSQWWNVTYLGDGYYSIINYFDKSTLEAEVWGELSWPTGGTQNPARLYSGRLTQQWRIATSASTGHSRIYNRKTGMVIYWQNAYPSDIFMKWASSNPEIILNESWKFVSK